ncbi:MAG: 50S ribosomal protein L21 [Peptococcaceae bacterium]|nr:50S ribosomal protein L21 [Peptococcaceae bacterium]
MYAVIESGGKQYTVRQGDVIKVEKLAAAVGESLEIDRVLLLGGDKVQIGAPLVKGAKVTAKVLEHGKNKKVIVFRYKPKKHVRVKKGHRQPYTKLSIESIAG